jgi:predicted phage baseplate assembly protein
MLFDPNRGRLLPPDLDDRTWSDLVSDVVALIPKYAPQWTNQGPGDVGITLVELFAWLVEGLTYRLNQVPDKNYIAFLNLLGITRVPPDPARSFLTFAATAGPTVVPAGSQAQTAATETQPPVIFETDTDVTILPINLEAALQISKSGSNKYSNLSHYFTTHPAPGSTITIAPSQAVQLCLGFDNPSTQTINLLVQLFQPLQPGEATVSWQYSTGTVAPSSWTALSVPGAADGTGQLTQDGVVAFTVPPDWASQAPTSWASTSPASAADVVTSAYYWIGLRVTNLSAANSLALGLSWILFNAVSSYSALTIAAPETLGRGDGTSFQVFALANGPLFATPGSATPYAHLVVQVNGVTWTQVDDFPAGPGSYYRVDPVQAQITFGNYDPLANTGHGTVPQTTDTVVATTYRYVEAGTAGNVGANSIIALTTLVPGISAVTNLFSAYGGSDAEPVAETMRRAPQLLRNRDRAVTADDYQSLALQASSELATVCCLPPTDAYGSGAYGAAGYGMLDRSAGNVNVIIVPAIGPDVSVAPTPTPELVQAVTAYLDSRRDVTALLKVTGPRYLPVDVTISASPWAAAISSGLISSANDVQVYIEAQIDLYLHPVVGGLDGTGWQVGQNVYIADLYKAIMPPENIGFISQLEIEAGTALYVGGRPPPPFLPAPALGAWVRVADYELICLGQINFTLGSAE